MTEDDNKKKSRVDRVEQAVQILKALALRADERMDDFDSALNNLTVKIEALADAQIRNEEILTRKVADIAVKVEALADAQIHHEEKAAAEMEALRDVQKSLAAKVEALVDAQIRNEEKLTRRFEAVAEKVEALADGQAHTDRRLDALIEIVREGRSGGAA